VFSSVIVIAPPRSVLYIRARVGPRSRREREDQRRPISSGTIFADLGYNRLSRRCHARLLRVDEHDGIDLWGDEAGAGKTTNAALGALERDHGHVIYFDKHEKAREFIKDDAIQDFEGGQFQDAEHVHLKGGEQKRHGHCMDADHADEDCPEHGHPSNCPKEQRTDPSTVHRDGNVASRETQTD